MSVLLSRKVNRCLVLSSKHEPGEFLHHRLAEVVVLIVEGAGAIMR